MSRHQRHAILILAIALAICGSELTQAQTAPSLVQTISYTFKQEGVPIQRKMRVAVTDVEVVIFYRTSAAPSEYPDANKLVPEALKFLQNFAGTTTYYEEIASALATELLTKYPVVNRARVSLAIYPDTERSYKRLAAADLERTGPAVK